MRFRATAAFGILAVAATVIAANSHAILGAVMLLGSLPLWLLFIVFLIRDLRP